MAFFAYPPEYALHGIYGGICKNPLDAVQMPAINPRVDLYDPNQTEILLLDDAIQVKEQKQTREKCTSQDGARAIGSRVSTDVMMLEKADGGFHYLTAGIDAQGEPTVPLEDIVRAKIAEEYGTTQAVLNIVAITDGAKAIRSRFVAIFGMAITLILDWYHLEAVWKPSLYKMRSYVICRARLRTDLLDNRS